VAARARFSIDVNTRGWPRWPAARRRGWAGSRAPSRRWASRAPAATSAIPGSSSG
jgi:hypothetical protein